MAINPRIGHTSTLNLLDNPVRTFQMHRATVPVIIHHLSGTIRTLHRRSISPHRTTLMDPLRHMEMHSIEPLTLHITAPLRCGRRARRTQETSHCTDTLGNRCPLSNLQIRMRNTRRLRGWNHRVNCGGCPELPLLVFIKAYVMSRQV
jgi:hypothetical protein